MVTTFISILLLFTVIGNIFLYFKFRDIRVGQRVVIYEDQWKIKYKFDIVEQIDSENNCLITRTGDRLRFIDMLFNRFILQEDFE